MIKLQVNHGQHLRSEVFQPECSRESQTPKSKIILTQRQVTDTSNKKQENKQQSLIQISQKSKKDRQLQTIESIQNTQRKVKKEIEDLIEQYKSQAEKMMHNHGYDPEKQLQIKKQLDRLHREKQKRRGRIEREMKKLEARQRQLGITQNKSTEETELRRRSIEKRIEEIKQRQKTRHQEYQNFLKFYQNYKSKKPKYQIFEQQFKLKTQKQNEEKVRMHEEKVSNLYKPMNMEQIQTFDDQYMERKHEMEKKRLQNQIMQRKIQEQNQRKLSELYKGHCHQIVIRQLDQRLQKKNEGRQKNQRIKSYSEVVKEEHRPRVSKSSLNTEEDENRIDLFKLPQTERGGRRVLKQKYLKGHYQGKIVEYQKVPLSHNEQISKGIEYLQFLKKLPKKPKNKEERSVSAATEAKKQTVPVFRVQRRQNPLYKARKYKSIDFSGGEGSVAVKALMQMVRNRNEKMIQEEKVARYHNYKNKAEWQQKQRHISSCLVANIQEKLQMLKRL